MNETPIIEVKPEPIPPIEPFECWLVSYQIPSTDKKRMLRIHIAIDDAEQAERFALENAGRVVFHCAYPGNGEQVCAKTS